MPEPVKTPGPAWARWRAPIGYPLAALCLWLARPTFRSILIGSALIVLGLLIRAAAAGHLRKREALAHTGPYARTRNPLYLGSAFLAAGFAVASWSGVEPSLNGNRFSFSQYVRNREYQATIGAVLLIAVLAALATWRR
jgi:protein-S-isoprenylcysteine O-methyltransferase Ste14